MTIAAKNTETKPICRHKRKIAKKSTTFKNEARVLVFSVCIPCEIKECFDMLTRDEFEERYGSSEETRPREEHRPVVA